MLTPLFDFASLLQCRKFFETCNSESAEYKVLKSPDPKVETKVVHVEGSSLLVGSCTSVIDADVCTCLAYAFNARNCREALRERKYIRKRKDTVFRKVNDHTHINRDLRKFGLCGIATRDFRVKGVWDINEDKRNAFLAYEDTKDLDEEFPVKGNTIVGSVQAAYSFAQLQGIGGVPQTRVTFAGTLDLKGAIPRLPMNAIAQSSLILRMRKKFDMSFEVDAEERFAISERIKSEKPDVGEDFDHNFAERPKKVS